MKSFFKKIALVLVLAMAVTMLPAKAATAADAEGPQLSKQVKLYIGGDKSGSYSEAAYAKVWNKDGYTVEFSSSDETVATVGRRKGLVTAVSVGEAEITAVFTNEDGETVTKTCPVLVKKNAVAVGISENSQKTLLEGITVGETFQPMVFRTSADGETSWKGKDVITDGARFTSSNEEVFTVKKTTGKITAVAPGEATLTVWTVQGEKPAEVDENGKVVEYLATTEKVEYKVVVKAASFSVEATKVRELTVRGKFATSEKDMAFAVTKGNSTITIASSEIAEDGNSAVLTLASKMTAGTYTVKYGELSADVTVEDEHVEKIVILEDGGMATVMEKREGIYVHYQVLNQYGEDVRTSYSVSWVSSTGGTIVDTKGKGILSISAAENSPNGITYGTAVIITGVHTSTSGAVTVQASVTAGLERAVDTIEYVGITKDGTSEFAALPAGFTNGDYLVVYKMYDQLGYEIDYSDTDDSNLVFTSLSPLLIGSTFAGKANGVTIDGETYGARYLTRGVQADAGGDAKIQVTSTQTGRSTYIDLKLEYEQILTRFTLQVPDRIIAEGDSDDGSRVEIPYLAEDQNGNPITSFRVLYQAVTLSDAHLYFVEENDGTATLWYNVPTEAEVGASRNVDIPMIYTSTVIKTGNVSNITLNLKDKAIPSTVRAISGVTQMVEGDSTDVEGGNEANNHNKLLYYDQYDREMSSDLAALHFPATSFAVVKRNTSSKVLSVTGGMPTMTGYEDYIFFTASNPITIAAKEATDTIVSESLEFSIANWNSSSGKYDIEGTKKLPMKVVDLTQCKSFSFDFDDYSKLYVGEGHEYTEDTKFKVTGTLSDGTTVNIPPTVTGIIETVTVEGVNVDNISNRTYVVLTDVTISKEVENKVAAVTGSALTVMLQNRDQIADNAEAKGPYRDQSVTNANGSHPYRFMDATVTADIRAYVKDGANMDVPSLRETLTQKIQFSIETPRVVAINGAESTVIKATNGVISYGKLIDWGHLWHVIDQYDHELGHDGVIVTISKVEESADGLYSSSTNDENYKKPFVVNSNSTTNTEIRNAEIGDTFVATYSFTRDGVSVSHSIKITVGSDTTAWFTTSSQICNWR